MDLDKTRERVPSFRYADCCAYCKFGGSDNDAKNFLKIMKKDEKI